MKVLGKEYEVSNSAIALNWVMCKGAIPLVERRYTKQALKVEYDPFFRCVV